jgi:hypothetical protein
MRWSAALVAPALTGCSLIYNPNNLPEATVYDARIVDADPCALAITDLGPAAIDEGQGDGGSAPALVVVRGDNFVNANLRATLAATTGTAMLGSITDAVASADHHYIAFTVTAHVDTVLGKTGETFVPLALTISQDAPMSGATCASMMTRSDLLRLRGLPELTSMSTAEVSGTTVTTQALKASGYSQVNLMDLPSVSFANEMNATSSTPAVVTAVSSILLPAVTASATGAKAGPGGYAGAVTKGMGSGGGDIGAPAQTLGTGGGGGGGAFANDATSGATGSNGGTGGIGGHHYGDDALASLDGNVPSAGGGGGAGSLAGGAAGGTGGGGGGVVALFAGGDLTTGTITTNGGMGGPGASGVGSGGGGGAGAGGLVIVSSQHGALSVGRVNVKANTGGSPGGGASSVGRVRWDALAGSGPMSPDRPAHRGPVFMVASRVFTTLPQTLTLLGTADDRFNITVTDHDHVRHDGGRSSFGGDGTALITPPLSAGYNRVCITLDGGAQGHPEADRCIDLAVLP